KLVASGGGDGMVRLWDAATMRERAVLGPHAGYILRIAFSADGKTLACAGHQGTIWVWDLGGEQPRQREPISPAWGGLALSADGRQVLAASRENRKRVCLWDVATGKELKRFDGHTTDVLVVAVAPGGKHALSGSLNAEMILWDLDTGKEVRRFVG